MWWMAKRSFLSGMDLLHMQARLLFHGQTVLRLCPIGLGVRDPNLGLSDHFFLPSPFQMYTMKRTLFWEVVNLCCLSL